MRRIHRPGAILTLFVLLTASLLVLGAMGPVWASTMPLPTPGALPSVGDSQLVGSPAPPSGPSPVQTASLGSNPASDASGLAGAFTGGPGTLTYVFQPESTSGHTILPLARIITVTSSSGVWTAIGEGTSISGGPAAGSGPANPAMGSRDLADALPASPTGAALLVMTPPGNTVSWNFSAPPAGNQSGPVVLASLSPGPVFAGIARARDDGGCDPTKGCPQTPEPGTLLLVGSGLVAVGFFWGRKRWFSGANISFDGAHT